MDKQRSRREALAKRVYGMCWPQEAGWPTWCGAHEVAQRRAESVADFILAEQERREGPLVKCVDEALDFLDAAAHDLKNSSLTDTDRASCSQIVMAHFNLIKAALAAFHAIDAPPQRTVEQIAADVVELRPGREFSDMPDMLATFKRLDALTDELAAALKRAEGERNAEGVKRGKE